MKIRLLQAFLIIILIFITPKIVAEENRDLACFDQIIEITDDPVFNGWVIVLSLSDKKEIQLQKFIPESNGQDDLTKSRGETYILDSCSNFTQPKELYDYYQINFDKYIKENSNKVTKPSKPFQDDGNIQIFRKIKADINLSNRNIEASTSETEKIEKKEKINLDKALNELVDSTKEIKKLFESKYELNQKAFPYKDASLEIVNLIKNKWNSIKDDKCQNDDNETQLQNCEAKKDKIDLFKKNTLLDLKNIELFQNYKKKIDSCFNSDGFDENNCNTDEEINFEDPSDYLNKFISKYDKEEGRLTSVFLGLLEDKFIYKEFEKEIDDYVNEVLEPFINKTKNAINKDKQDKIKQQEKEDREKKEREKKEKRDEFIELFKEESKFSTIEVNIDNTRTDSIDLINTNINKLDLEELNDLESRIQTIINSIESSKNSINSNSPDDIDEIINRIKKLKDFKKYKDDSEVKNILRNLNNEKDNRKTIIDELDSLIRKLNKKIKSFETKKSLLEQSEKEQKEYETQIRNLENKIFSLDNNLKVEINSKLFYMWAFFISLISLLGFTAFHIYRFQQHRSSADHTLRSSFNEQYKQIINENKSLKQELEKIKNQIQIREQTSAPVKERTFKSRFEDEQSQETKPKISPLNEMLSFYDNVLRDPNKIEAFTSTYQAIALDRQSRIISQGETILIKDNKGFSKSNFWMVFIDNRYILLPGRTLNVNVSSLIADNYRYARDLLSGIFSYKLGNEFKMLQFAELEKNGDSFKVIAEGSLSLPQT